MKPPIGPVSTYLDFGMTQGGRRTSYDYYEGQHAYDLFMGARYLHDVIAYRTGDLQAVYHPEDLRDNLRKHTALSVCTSADADLTYYEIGSSVFGAIDAVRFLDQRYRTLAGRQITWEGVDNSPFMNHMANYLHQDEQVHVTPHVRSVPCDLFFAKGVSLLYAMSNEQQLAEVLAGARIAVFDYTFSRGERIHDVVGTGLPVTFLSLDRLRELLQMGGRVLRLEPYTIKRYHQTPDKVTYDCLYGDSAVVDAYVSEMERREAGFPALWGRPLMRTAAYA